jgi:Ca-activated chloride channel family protein
LKATLRVSLLLLRTLVISLAPVSAGQSVDDVHIVPRTDPNRTGAQPEVVATEGSSAAYARTKPFRVQVNLVLVPVTVTDAMERPVMTLSKQDFALYEDDKRQEIEFFSAEAEPLSVALLVDVSKSMTDKIDTERAAVVEFFRNANPQDEYFAIAFSDKPRLVATATQSLDEIESKLTSIQPSGSTAMLDAIYLAQSELRYARYKRRAIVIISDGGDNSSRYSLREIKRQSQECDVPIYAIGLFETFFFNTIEEKLGKRWLREITDATGGRTVTVEDRDKLPEAAAQLSREMRSEYMLGYRPAGRVANRWRRIKVQVVASAKHPFRAHYKNGYISPGQ